MKPGMPEAEAHAMSMRDVFQGYRKQDAQFLITDGRPKFYALHGVG